MTEPRLRFSAEEYAARLNAVRSLMAALGIDTLVLSDPCNLYYLTGYDAWSFYTPQFLVVPGHGGSPIWLGRGMDRRGAQITSWLNDDALLAYPDHYVQSPDRHPAELLCDLLRERGWHRGAVGLEAESYYLNARAWRIVEASLGDATLVDASLLVNQVRLIKSPAEIALMRQAAGIVEQAMATALDMAAPGVRECDVAGEIYRALMRGTPDHGGDYTSSPPFMPSGDRVDTPHLSWRDTPYQTDSQINFELMACRQRYHVPMSRTLWLGQPPTRLLDMESAALEAIEAALAAARPGARACDVEAAWQAVAQRYGLRKASRCGYSIGIAYPPTVGEQTVSLRPEDKTVLEPGMTFHLMPGVWQDGASIVITESFHVTDSGAETFCTFPRRLFVRP